MPTRTNYDTPFWRAKCVECGKPRYTSTHHIRPQYGGHRFVEKILEKPASGQDKPRRAERR